MFWKKIGRSGQPVGGSAAEGDVNKRGKDDNTPCTTRHGSEISDSTATWAPPSAPPEHVPPQALAHPPSWRPVTDLTITKLAPDDMRQGPFGVEAFVVVKPIGGGKASAVYKAMHRASQHVVALKTYTKAGMHPVHAHQCQREMDIHAAACMPGVVPLYASWEDPDFFYLVMEFVGGGDLFHVMHTRERLSEGTAARRVIGPVCTALARLHRTGIFHRDIKPENILVRPDSTILLGDLGLAIDHRRERPTTRLGTLEYMPPEVLQCPAKVSCECNRDLSRPTYDSRCDVWSVGVLAWEIVTGLSPFYDRTKDLIKANILTKLPAIPKKMSAELEDFVLQCLKKTYDERPSMEELLQHPWLAKHGYVPVDLADAASDDRREGTGTLSSQDARVSRSVEFSRSVPVHAVLCSVQESKVEAPPQASTSRLSADRPARGKLVGASVESSKF